jgi:hypothetical protein
MKPLEMHASAFSNMPKTKWCTAIWFHFTQPTCFVKVNLLWCNNFGEACRRAETTSSGVGDRKKPDTEVPG